MAKQARCGGGLAAVQYTVRKARQAGIGRMIRRLQSHNACETCALGMSGMRNEGASLSAA